MRPTVSLGLLSLVACTLFMSACSNSSQKTQVTRVAGMEIPNLIPEDTLKGVPDEQFVINSDFKNAINELRANKDNPMPFLKLAEVFIREGRISGNDVYYSSAALKMLERVLQGETTTEDQRFYALSLKSMVLLRMHHYQEALDAARQSLSISQYNSGVWGCIADAQMELGQYDSAVQACDRMVGLRPDLRSYARVAELRQIYGKNKAAIEAMKMAVASGVPGLEPTEWARVQLGDLFFNQGVPDSARRAYEYSLGYRPQYPAAQIGLARVYAVNGNLDSAILLANAALHHQPEPDYSAFLAALYERKGDTAQAKKIRTDLVQTLQKADALEAKEAKYKHDRSRDFALAYLSLGAWDEALRYARKDYDERPLNEDANELMAWLSFRKGDLHSAQSFAEKTLRTGSRNPVLLYECGQIFSAAGDTVKGAALTQEALSIMPYLKASLLLPR